MKAPISEWSNSNPVAEVKLLTAFVIFLVFLSFTERLDFWNLIRKWTAIADEEVTVENFCLSLTKGSKWQKCYIFLINAQNVSIFYSAINEISQHLDFNVYQQDQGFCSQIGLPVEQAKINLQTLKPMYSFGKWWKWKKILMGFVYRVVRVLKALWIILSETINILRKVQKLTFSGCPRKFYHRVMHIAPSTGHISLTFNMPFKLIVRRCEVVFWCLEWECCTFWKIDGNSFKSTNTILWL